jgi:hypothetical protein
LGFFCLFVVTKWVSRRGSIDPAGER